MTSTIRATALALATATASLAGIASAVAGNAEGAYVVVGVASNDVLNMRTGPGVNYAIQNVLYPGEGGIVADRCARNGRWCHVSTSSPNGVGGKQGWVNMRYLRAY